MVMFCKSVYNAIRIIYKKRRLQLERQRSRSTTSSRFNSILSKPLRLLGGLLKKLSGKRCGAFFRGTNRFFLKISTHGTFENSLLKNIFGFVSGIVISHMLYFYLLLIMKVRFSIAFCLTLIIGTYLMQGLAFSEEARCTTLLVLPQFCTKQGREILTMYSFYLTSVPITNTITNAQILADNIVCKQEIISRQLQAYLDILKNPLIFARDKFSDVKNAVNEMVVDIKNKLMTTKRILFGILDTIKSAKEWLESIFNICSNKVGTPFQRCMKVFDDFMDDCVVQLSSSFRWVCSPAYVASSICYAVKVVDVMCSFVAFIDDTFFAKIKERMRKFSLIIKEMVYADVEFHHSYSYNMTQNDTMMRFVEDYIDDFAARTRAIFYAIDFSNILLPLLSLYMLYRVFSYHWRYLKQKNYDNVYLTDDFLQIDGYRAARELSSILPLTEKERLKYVYLSDFSLLKKEKRKILSSSVRMFISVVQIGVLMLIDWSFYWLTLMVQKTDEYFYEIQADLQPVEYEIQGNNSLSRLLKKVLKALKPDTKDFTQERCIIQGSRPNVFIECELIFLTTAIWLIQILEPYGLRTRQYIMKMYHPKASLERSAWLYNRILSKRKSLLNEIPRIMARKANLLGPSSEKNQLKKLLLSKFPWLSRFGIGGFSNKYCGLCGNALLDEEVQQCLNELCTAVYCKVCFADVTNKCAFCDCPFNFYDEVNCLDISEEIDSSSEESIIFEAHSNKKNESGSEKKVELLVQRIELKHYSIQDGSYTEDSEDTTEEQVLLTNRYDRDYNYETERSEMSTNFYFQDDISTDSNETFNGKRLHHPSMNFCRHETEEKESTKPAGFYESITVDRWKTERSKTKRLSAAPMNFNTYETKERNHKISPSSCEDFKEEITHNQSKIETGDKKTAASYLTSDFCMSDSSSIFDQTECLSENNRINTSLIEDSDSSADSDTDHFAEDRFRFHNNFIQYTCLERNAKERRIIGSHTEIETNRINWPNSETEATKIDIAGNNCNVFDAADLVHLSEAPTAINVSKNIPYLSSNQAQTVGKFDNSQTYVHLTDKQNISVKEMYAPVDSGISGSKEINMAPPKAVVIKNIYFGNDDSGYGDCLNKLKDKIKFKDPSKHRSHFTVKHPSEGNIERAHRFIKTSGKGNDSEICFNLEQHRIDIEVNNSDRDNDNDDDDASSINSNDKNSEMMDSSSGSHSLVAEEKNKLKTKSKTAVANKLPVCDKCSNKYKERILSGPVYPLRTPEFSKVLDEFRQRFKTCNCVDYENL